MILFLVLFAILIVFVSFLTYVKLKNSELFQSFIEEVTTLDVDGKTPDDIIRENNRIKKEAREKIKQQMVEIEERNASNKVLIENLNIEVADKKQKGGKKTKKTKKTNE